VGTAGRSHRRELLRCGIFIPIFIHDKAAVPTLSVREDRPRAPESHQEGGLLNYYSTDAAAERLVNLAIDLYNNA